jgi:uncharacterized protein (DUF983 family)
MKTKPKIKLTRCPKCGSGQTYYRERDNSHKCRNCGNEFNDKKGA